MKFQKNLRINGNHKLIWYRIGIYSLFFFIVYIIIFEQGERGWLIVCDLRSLVRLSFRLPRFPPCGWTYPRPWPARSACPCDTSKCFDVLLGLGSWWFPCCRILVSRTDQPPPCSLYISLLRMPIRWALMMCVMLSRIAHEMLTLCVRVNLIHWRTQFIAWTTSEAAGSFTQMLVSSTIIQSLDCISIVASWLNLILASLRVNISECNRAGATVRPACYNSLKRNGEPRQVFPTIPRSNDPRNRN